MKNELFVDGLVFGEFPEGLECLGMYGKDGIAKAKKNGFWGYVDRNLVWVVPPLFDEVRGGYKGDRTEVKRNMRWDFVGCLKNEASGLAWPTTALPAVPSTDAALIPFLRLAA